MNSGYLTTTQHCLQLVNAAQTTPMRVLIIGVRGMLGTDLLKEWDTDELIPVVIRKRRSR
jgi:hypothetical protein